jgi:L-malate glycosyltransferase
LKIGVVCYATLGGSGIIATELGLALASRGHEVHFIASSTPWRFPAETPNVFFHQVPNLRAPGDTYTVALAQTIALVAPQLDVLHVHYAVPHAVSAVLALELLEGPKPVLVNTLHGTDVSEALSPLLRRALDKSQGITVPSEYLRQSATEILRPRLPIEVISNFVDTERFAPGVRTQAPALLHASNFRPLKRVHDVLEVFRRVRAQVPCTLLLAGNGDEHARSMREAESLGPDVVFLGAREDMASLLRSTRVFILTSASESFSLAALEAQSAGVPVVGTAVGGLGEVVKHGETGFLFPLGDTEAMANAVLRLLRDDTLAEAMSKKARAHAVARFSQSLQVDRYEAYFSSLT